MVAFYPLSSSACAPIRRATATHATPTRAPTSREMAERERKMRKLMGGGDGSSSSGSGIATTGSFEYFECSRYI